MESTLKRLVARHKALAHPARLRILAILRGTELCACQITAILPFAASTVSAHLKELRLAGWIEERKQGRWVYYRLAGGSSTEGWLDPLWPELEADPQARADAALLSALRTVTVEELCRANLDLVQLGIERPPVGETEGQKGK